MTPSPETDEAVASARGSLERIQGRDALPVAPARPKRASGVVKRLAAIGAANAVILIAAVVLGLIVPLGIFGALGVIALMIAATLAIALMPASRPVAYEKLRESDIRALPAQTGHWLDAQRPALPAPARTLVDRIGVQLDALTPQLATLDADAPAATEVRKLVAEQLPEFVRGYQKVPAGMRGVPRNGKTPDAQLVDGLSLIEGQIAEMSAQLAQGDLDNLATRGRYLEIKYRSDEG